MTYTIADLNEAVEGGFTYKSKYSGEDYEVKGWHELEGACDGDPVNLSVGAATLVESYGGMGMGSERWFVFRVTDAEGNERFFKRHGYYASHYGSDFDGPTEEVRLTEKVVTVWQGI